MIRRKGKRTFSILGALLKVFIDNDANDDGGNDNDGKADDGNGGGQRWRPFAKKISLKKVATSKAKFG